MRKAFVFLLLCLALLPVAAENFRILDYSVGKCIGAISDE